MLLYTHVHGGFDKRQAGRRIEKAEEVDNRGNAESLSGWHVKVTVHSAGARDSVYCIP